MHLVFRFMNDGSADPCVRYRHGHVVFDHGIGDDRCGDSLASLEALLRVLKCTESVLLTL